MSRKEDDAFVDAMMLFLSDTCEWLVPMSRGPVRVSDTILRREQFSPAEKLGKILCALEREQYPDPQTSDAPSWDANGSPVP